MTDSRELYDKVRALSGEELERFLADLSEVQREEVEDHLRKTRESEEKSDLGTLPHGDTQDDAGTIVPDQQDRPSSVVPSTPKRKVVSTPVSLANYKILQQIGQGGMGQVFMAEQQRPVKRRVALKVIISDTPTDKILARFEAERQALAMMDHHHIARVLDAGVTDDGRPYFAMELVKGIPITNYCDSNRLLLDARLELFVQACRAIEHAHRQGIIHRDLKPANILVAIYDGKPSVKVIDFGLAKAIHPQLELTEKTLHTYFGQVIGTLEYMSPEQADLNALDIDTRADVYSLGVVLYELLAGSTPLRNERVRSEAFDRILALIREEDSPRPSTRLSESGDALSDISRNRNIDSRSLGLLLRGDLDWITMKALDKDRTRRYGGAAELADDVERYLNDEPVEACPPSLKYRVRKAIRKHRKEWITAASVAVTVGACLLLFVGGAYLWSIKKQSSQIATLRAEFDSSLRELTIERDSLEEIEDVLKKIALIDEQESIASRRRLVDDVKEKVTGALKRSSLSNSELGDIERSIKFFQGRDDDLFSSLSEAVERRKASWVELLNLDRPFMLQESDGLVANEDTVGRPAEVKTQRYIFDKQLPSNWLEVEVDFAAQWRQQSQLSVEVVPDNGAAIRFELRAASSKAGKRAASTSKAKDNNSKQVLSQIWRGDQRIKSRKDPLATISGSDRLKFFARLEGSRMTFQIGDQDPLEMDDLFHPGQQGNARLALHWPSDLRIHRIRVKSREQPQQASPMTIAKRRHAAGDTGSAWKIYSDVAKSNDETSEVQREAQLRAAVCLLEMKRTKDAVELLRGFSSGVDDWSLLAKVVMLKTELDDEFSDVANALIEAIAVHPRREEINHLVPDYVADEIREKFKQRDNNAYYFIKPDLQRLQRWERWVTLLVLLKTDPEEIAFERLRLAQLYDIANRHDEATKTYEDILADHSNGQYDEYTIDLALEGLCSQLIRKGKQSEATRVAERVLSERQKRKGDDRTVQLVHAITLANEKRWDEASELINQWIKSSTNDYDSDILKAHMVLGFVYDSTDDQESARASWSRGWETARERGLSSHIWASICGSLSGGMTAEDSLSMMKGVSSGGALSSVLTYFSRPGFIPTELLHSVLSRLWVSRRGKEAARRIALLQATEEQQHMDQVRLTTYEVLRQCILGSANLDGQLLPEQDRLIWSGCSDAVQLYVRGEFAEGNLLPMFLTWKGYTGFGGWPELKKAFPDNIRGALTYSLGKHYIHQNGRGPEFAATYTLDEAEMILKDARSIEDDALRPLLDEAFDHLEKARGRGKPAPATLEDDGGDGDSAKASS